MRSIIVSFLLALVFIPATSFAKGEPRFKVFGLYGLAMPALNDINNIQKTFSAPKPGDITSGNMYGGGFGLRMGERWELVASWEQMLAKNLASNGNGFDIMQTMAWLDLNFYLIQKKAFFMYMGVGGGYALGSSVDRKQGTKTEFTGDKNTFGGEGQLGFGFMLGKHFSIFFEGGYQYFQAPNIVADVGGSRLSKATGGNATLDLSGGKGIAGLGIHF